MDVELRTERLVLRQPVTSDASAVARGLNDFEVTRHLSVVPFPYAEADAVAWLGSLRPARPGSVHLAIELPGEGLIGVVSIEKQLGYWLDRRFHGRGIMTEAGEALLDWHFAALPEDVVRSGAHVGNAASLNVQRKLGFAEAGAPEPRFVRSQNRTVEHIETVLTRPAFEAARQRLKGH